MRKGFAELTEQESQGLFSQRLVYTQKCFCTNMRRPLLAIKNYARFKAIMHWMNFSDAKATFISFAHSLWLGLCNLL